MTIDEIYINLCYSGMFKNIIGYYGKEKKRIGVFLSMWKGMASALK